MKTLQQIADIIAKHLFNQKEKCAILGNCRYRLEEDGQVNKCAFGALIPDELYTGEIEGKGSDTLFSKFPELIAACGIPDDSDTYEFLHIAQRIHDGEWRNRNESFERLCQGYNLEYNPQ